MNHSTLTAEMCAGCAAPLYEDELTAGRCDDCRDKPAALIATMSHERIEARVAIRLALASLRAGIGTTAQG